MFKLNREFDTIWEKASNSNSAYKKPRFLRIFQQSKRFVTVGIYDNHTKKYELFDSINFAGNFRYNKNRRPPEFDRMEKLIRGYNG